VELQPVGRPPGWRVEAVADGTDGCGHQWGGVSSHMPSSSARGIGRRGFESIVRSAVFQRAKPPPVAGSRAPGGPPEAPVPGRMDRSCPGPPVPVVPASVARVPSHCRSPRLGTDRRSGPATTHRDRPAPARAASARTAARARAKPYVTGNAMPRLP
jgi:hypothetical protein